jgi:F-type H+-transporting ATPase subunit epsilon
VAATLQLEVATPERLLIKSEVTAVTVPGKEGALGILPEHAPLISELGIGELTYVEQGRTRSLFVANGWVEVLPDHVRVLADRAEKAGEIDMKRAQEALDRAMTRLTAPTPEMDVGRALNAMRRAQSRLEAARHKNG